MPIGDAPQWGDLNAQFDEEKWRTNGAQQFTFEPHVLATQGRTHFSTPPLAQTEPSFVFIVVRNQVKYSKLPPEDLAFEPKSIGVGHAFVDLARSGSDSAHHVANRSPLEPSRGTPLGLECGPLIA
jgi:hypothetical protein